MSERLLRLPEVMGCVELGRSRLYALVAQGSFPKPIKLGRSSAWIESEITKWVAERIQEARGPGASRPESTGGDGSTPRSKALLPASRRRARAAEEARHE
jgi:prophage regulatory protein